MGVCLRRPGYSIDIWGRAAWTWLHVVAMNYPEEPNAKERVDMRDFLQSFTLHIPCLACQRHFAKMTRAERESADHSVYASRDAFARATVEWHNAVNRRLEKPEVQFDTFLSWFESPKPRKSSRYTASFIVLLLLYVCLKVAPISFLGGFRSVTLKAHSHHGSQDTKVPR